METTLVKVMHRKFVFVKV